MKKKSKVTIVDIANRLNVSKVTVSKALRDFPDISKELKERVKHVANEMGYMPNYFAKSLASGRSHTIGVILPRIEHSLFMSSIINGIYEAAYEKNYEVILMISHENADKELNHLQTLLSKSVDGLIIDVSKETQDPSRFYEIKDRNIPLVFFDRSIGLHNFSSVTIDNKLAAQNAVEYAIKQGFLQIAHLCGVTMISVAKDRLDGYYNALKENNIPINYEWIIECNDGIESAYNGFIKLFENQRPPKVVFAVSDLVAFGAYEAARVIGTEISKDIGIIGFGDTQYAKILSPPLTTIHQPAKQIGAKAVQVVIEEIADKDLKPRHIVLPTTLVARQSCFEKTTSTNIIMTDF